MNHRRLLSCGLALAMALAGAAAAQAHRVNVFAWVEGETVFVEGKYPDGTRVHQGAVRVLDSAGAVLLKGATNAQGEFSFKIPKPDDLTIVLEAGMGHRADWPLSRQDLAPPGDAPGPAPSVPAPAPPAETSPHAADAPGPSTAAFDAAVEKALDKKLAPMMKMLAEMHEQKVRLTDVLGGLGYILGLVGIAAYFKRKPGGPGR
jgi:nickel transport protein